MSENITKDIYFLKKSIGLFSLLTSLREQGDCIETANQWEALENCALHVIADLNIVFLTLDRLKRSLESQSRLDIALDGTSFLIFLRIYYDSLASTIRFMFQLLNPSNQRRWPKARSFADQIKWLDHNDDLYFDSYKRCLDEHEFKKSFHEMRKIRNELKESPSDINAKRLVWPSRKIYPITGDLLSLA